MFVNLLGLLSTKRASCSYPPVRGPCHAPVGDAHALPVAGAAHPLAKVAGDDGHPLAVVAAEDGQPLAAVGVADQPAIVDDQSAPAVDGHMGVGLQKGMPRLVACSPVKL